MSLSLLFGRLHPLIVHFPVALILLAACLEVARIKWDRRDLGFCVSLLLVVGTLGAVMSSFAGFVFAHEYYPPPSDRWMLERHRWLGITTTILAGAATMAAYQWANAGNGKVRWLRSGIIWLSAIAVSVTAHLGALMVWGADYFDVFQP